MRSAHYDSPRAKTKRNSSAAAPASRLPMRLGKPLGSLFDASAAPVEATAAPTAVAPLTVVHLDGLPGSGNTYTCSRLADENKSCAYIELDEITQRPGKHFGFSKIESREALERAFQQEINARLAVQRDLGATTVLLCGVSKVISEDYGEVTVVPNSLCAAKYWIDIAPQSPATEYPGELGESVARLEGMGVSALHISELVEGAQRSVLRDMKPEDWAVTADEWGDDSSFYQYMCDNHPDEQFSAEDFDSLFFSNDEAVLEELPELWTALVLDDMTGRGFNKPTEGEQYHKARATAEKEGYTPLYWSTVMRTIKGYC